MKHTKLTLLALAVLTALICLCGCGQESSPAAEKEPPVLAAVGEELKTSLGLTGTMSLTVAEAADYIGIAEGDVTELYAEIAEESIQSDLICLFKATDEAAAGRVAAALSSYLKQQSNAMKNYLPDEYAKLEGTEVHTDGLYVYAVVSGNKTAAEEILKKYF